MLIDTLLFSLRSRLWLGPTVQEEERKKKTFSMSQATYRRPAALQWFAQLMRLGYSWPIPRGREDRALRNEIIKRVREGFRTNRNETDPATIQRLLQFAMEQYQALEAMKKNAFFTKVSITSLLQSVGRSFDDSIPSTHSQIPVKSQVWLSEQRQVSSQTKMLTISNAYTLTLSIKNSSYHFSAHNFLNVSARFSNTSLLSTAFLMTSNARAFLVLAWVNIHK